jgi:dipeptidyl-peptidase 4
MPSNTPSRRRRLFVGSLALLVFGALAPVTAQSQRLVDQLQRIFQSSEYSPETFGPAVWFDDNRSYGMVERTGAGGAQELVEYDAVSGARTVLADASALTPKGGAAPLAIAGYAWTADRRRGLIFANTRPVWRLNTRGDYWLLGSSAATRRSRR